MRTNEAEHTHIELAVATVLTGFMVQLMMPALQGFQSDEQVRQLAEQVVLKMREAETAASAQDQFINWSTSYEVPPFGIKFSEPSGSVFAEVDVPSNLHVTGVCDRGVIEPQGTVNVAIPPCANPGATFEIMCFDSNTAANPFGIKITVVVATGQIISQTAGRCP